MDMGLAMVVMALLMLGLVVLIVLGLYWVVRLAVRHGSADARRQPPA